MEASNGGEAGIRTLGRALRPYNGLANRRLQPLGHLTLRLAPTLRFVTRSGQALARLGRERRVPVYGLSCLG
jgi:hypothetical protein